MGHIEQQPARPLLHDHGRRTQTVRVRSRALEPTRRFDSPGARTGPGGGIAMLHRSQRDFEDEIRSHLELEADRLIEEGLSPDEAQHAARRRFGNVTKAQERHHNTGRSVWAEQLAQDVRYAARMLRKSPLFSSIAILTVALGIGANTAVFSIVNGVLLSPLPYREPERLVKIWETLPGLSEATVSYPDYKDWQERARVFNGVAVYSPYSNRTLTGGDVPERVGVGL